MLGSEHSCRGNCVTELKMNTSFLKGNRYTQCSQEDKCTLRLG